jgi:CopA family copper-resistance protein
MNQDWKRKPMQQSHFNHNRGAMTRRGFVLGAVGSMAAYSSPGWSRPGWSSPGWSASMPPSQSSAAQLRASHFELTVDEQRVNVTGKQRMATAVNGSLPGPTLRWREGDLVTVAVTNRLHRPTSIHWHGIRLPAGMDGVPGLSFPGIAPGERFVYRIPVLQRGSYWYHSHSRFQEQTGLYGALVVEGRQPEAVQADREHVLLLSDWTDANPETIFSNLKEQSDYYNYHRTTVGDLVHSAREHGLHAALARGLMWGRMNMSPSDIADVTGATYTYLLNGQTPRSNWTGLFRPGERVRLRVINGSSMTFVDLRIPGLTLTVVQADGNDVQPVEVDEFRIAPAETYDVIVQPSEDRAYTIFAQAEDRSGFARGTLAAHLGQSAEIPPMDPRPVRTMTDMGMNMASMKDMRGMKAPSHPTHQVGMQPDMQPGMQPDMRMDMADSMSMHARRPVAPEIASAATKEPSIHPLPQPGPGVHPMVLPLPKIEQVHATSPELRLGPQVDNIADAVQERLTQAGDGLDGNGRRVLTYADLRALYPGVDPRPPQREITLHLSGNMERYIWGFDGKKFSDAHPIQLTLGERVRIVLINDTMMEHPIHLHGLWSELETGYGPHNPYKHTVIVKPAERVSYLVTADTPGKWAFHCHLLYHMEAGMFRVVEVA